MLKEVEDVRDIIAVTCIHQTSPIGIGIGLLLLMITCMSLFYSFKSFGSSSGTRSLQRILWKAG